MFASGEGRCAGYLSDSALTLSIAAAENFTEPRWIATAIARIPPAMNFARNCATTILRHL
jgi:hypothetical protein